MTNRIFNLIVLLVTCFALSQVAQAGPGTSTSNVNVVNIPNVSVVNTSNNPAVVTFANTPTVQDRDSPARQPFQDYGSGSFNDGSDTAIATISVPAANRLVIEHVSMVANMPVGQKVLKADVTPVIGNRGLAYDLIVIAQGTNAPGTFDYFGVSQDIRLYSDPGSNIQLRAYRDSNAGAATVQFLLSGHLVTIP